MSFQNRRDQKRLRSADRAVKKAAARRKINPSGTVTTVKAGEVKGQRYLRKQGFNYSTLVASVLLAGDTMFKAPTNRAEFNQAFR